MKVCAVGTNTLMFAVTFPPALHGGRDRSTTSDAIIVEALFCSRKGKDFLETIVNDQGHISSLVRLSMQCVKLTSNHNTG